MRLNFFRHKQPVCNTPEPPRKITPPFEVPREVWLKHFIQSYRRSSMQMEMLSDYTKNLEDAYHLLQQENQNLKDRYDFIHGYMKHINEAGARECELQIENRQLRTKLNKQTKYIKDFIANKQGLYKDYKTAIRGQYYYIHYLKKVLHLNHVDYKKKVSFNTLDFDNIDTLINEAVSEKN